MDSGIADDRLRLLFTCCHPRCRCRVAGRAGAADPVRPDARPRSPAFRCPRRRWPSGWSGPSRRSPSRASRTGCRRPRGCRSGRRPCSRVLYLMFTEGYAATAGPQLVRVDLCHEAIDLARALAEADAGRPGGAGLLALLLLQHARASARGRRRRRRWSRWRSRTAARWDRPRSTRGWRSCGRAVRRERGRVRTSCRR